MAFFFTMPMSKIIPIIAIIGSSIYNEAINLWVIIGALIVFGANFINISSEHKNNN